jgi:hypothetical protein
MTLTGALEGAPFGSPVSMKVLACFQDAAAKLVSLKLIW